MKAQVIFLTTEERELMDQCSVELTRKNGFQLKDPDLEIYETKLPEFELTKFYDTADVQNVFEKKSNGINILIYFIKFSKVLSGKYGPCSVEYFKVLGYFEFQNTFGDMLVRPESFEDKLREFFYKAEVDFEDHKEFSSKYYVITNEEDKLRSNIKAEFLDLMNNYNDLFIETKGNSILVSLELPVSVANTSEIVDFCISASKLFKTV